MAKKQNTLETAEQLAAPLLAEMGLTLWDAAYEKEGSQWFLRYYIDKDGGVSIDDCEAFSRAIEAVLDAADPIESSYVLEVSSPGIERRLTRSRHYSELMGMPVTVRLVRPVEGSGQREFTGVLTGYEQGNATIRLGDDMEMTFSESEAAWVKLYNDFGNEGAAK